MVEQCDNNKEIIPTCSVTGIEPGQKILQKDYVFSTRQLAAFFDCYQNNGEPATETIRDWWYSGRIPPPDIRISRKAIYWKHETVLNFVNAGGLL